MAYFSNAKEGDKVHCTRFGDGVITMFFADMHYALMVTFESGKDIPYTIDGIPALDEVEEQTLFYKDEKG